MQKRYVFLFIANILLTLFILYSCNEPNVVENKKIEKQEKPVLKNLTKEHFTLSSINKDSLTMDEIKIHNSVIITDLRGARRKKLIEYLNIHKVSKTISKTNSSILPDYFNCGDHFTFYWEPEQLYRSKPGKWLGIWPPDGVDWTKLHDQYGYYSKFFLC